MADKIFIQQIYEQLIGWIEILYFASELRSNQDVRSI